MIMNKYIPINLVLIGLNENNELHIQQLIQLVTLATSDMLSQAPPTREYFPSPILAKMTEAESSGPTANGVCL